MRVWRMNLRRTKSWLFYWFAFLFLFLQIHHEQFTFSVFAFVLYGCVIFATIILLLYDIYPDFYHNYLVKHIALKTEQPPLYQVPSNGIRFITLSDVICLGALNALVPWDRSLRLPVGFIAACLFQSFNAFESMHRRFLPAWHKFYFRLQEAVNMSIELRLIGLVIACLIQPENNSLVCQ